MTKKFPVLVFLTVIRAESIFNEYSPVQIKSSQIPSFYNLGLGSFGCNFGFAKPHSLHCCCRALSVLMLSFDSSQ